MPGWSLLGKLLDDEEPMWQAQEEFFMKLKEKDKRPRHKFKVGDIVRYKPGRHGEMSPEGVVLKVEFLESNDIRQRCYCVLAPDELTLRNAVRRIAKKLFFEPDYKASQLVTVENNRLVYVGDCPKSWLQPITSMEIQTSRFSDLLEEEEEDGPEPGEDP